MRWAIRDSDDVWGARFTSRKKAIKYLKHIRKVNAKDYPASEFKLVRLVTKHDQLRETVIECLNVIGDCVVGPTMTAVYDTLNKAVRK